MSMLSEKLPRIARLLVHTSQRMGPGKTHARPAAAHKALLFAALLPAGLLAPAAAEASEPATVSTVHVLERTTAGPAEFNVTFQVVASGSPGGDRAPTRLAILGLVDRAHDVPRPVPVSMMSANDDRYGDLYIPGERIHACEEQGCGQSGFVGVVTVNVRLSDDGEDGALTRLILIGESRTPAELTSTKLDGWQVVEASPEFAFAEREQTTAVGWDGPVGTTSVTSSEVFLEARLPGGEGSSVAMAQPPCSATTGGTIGIGSARLLGGFAEPEAHCPVDPARTTEQLTSLRVDEWVDDFWLGRHAGPIADVSPAATEWVFQADGAVAGKTAHAEPRLLVTAVPAFSPGLECLHLPWVPHAVSAADNCA